MEMKRILAGLLAAVLIVSMAVGAFAATAAVSGIDARNFQANLKTNSANGYVLLDAKRLSSDKLADLKPTAGSELKIYLTSNLFVDKNSVNLATTAAPNTYLTKSQIRAGKITIKRTTSKGKAVIDSFGIKYDKKGAYIGVEFVEPYASIKETEFSGTYYLYVNDKRIDSTKLTIAGTLENEIIEVDRDTEYVDLSEGVVAEAVDSATKVELYLGEELTVLANLRKGKKYYATCTTEPSDQDLDVMEKYPDIVEVYTLTTINLAPTGNVATFDTDQYYAYDATGKYLGTTSKRLPFSQKYYLSETKYASLTLA